MASTGLSDFGLISEGMDTAALRSQNLADLKQQAQLRQQHIATGDIGLEELQRERDTRANVRKAGVDATTAGKTMGGSFMDMAEAARRSGDTELATKYLDAYRQMDAMGAKDFIHAIMTNDAPGDRPDLVDLMRRNDMTKDVTSVRVGDHGNYTVTRANGQSSTQNAGRMAQLMGMIAPPTIHNIPAGGVGALSGPGIDPTDPRNQIQTPKTFPEHPQQGYVVKTSKDADGNEVQHIIDVRPTVDGKPNQNYGQEVAPASTGTGTTSPNIRRDLPVLNDINKGILELGTEYGSTDMTDPLRPIVKFTPKGQQVALVAEQIRIANQNLPPRTIINMAVNGKPMWKNENGKRTGVVIYHGQEFPMSTPSGQPVARPAPAAAAAPAGAPTPAAPAPGVPAPKSAPAAVPERDVLDEGQQYEAQDKELATLGNRARMLRGYTGAGAAAEAAKAVTAYGQRLEQLKSGTSGAPAPTQTPFERMGIETSGGTPTKSLAGGGTDQTAKLLQRGERFEKDDQLLRRTGAEIRRLLSTQGTKRNPSILRGAIEDYQRRLGQLEKVR